jgi:hypothetical protein
MQRRIDTRPLPPNQAAHAARRPQADVGVVVFKPFPLRKNSLCGFFSVRLPSGLILHSCKLMQGPTVALPALPQLDTGGRHKVDVNGRKMHVPAAEIPDRAAADRFHDMVLAAIERDAPELLREAPS